MCKKQLMDRNYLGNQGISGNLWDRCFSREKMVGEVSIANLLEPQKILGLEMALKLR